jgi:DNA-binding transcriptional LysR family regulator
MANKQGNQPDPKVMRYFVVLADALSFRHAAFRRGVTQPALTLALRRLDEALVHRTCRAMELTRAGSGYGAGVQAFSKMLGEWSCRL